VNEGTNVTAEEKNAKEIVDRLTKELKHLRFLGWWNHYAAYTAHLISILASFTASILAALSGLSKCVITVAVVAALPGTLLATQNVMRFEYKCGWYYKKARLLQHVLDALKFEDWDSKKASQELQKIEEKMDREWPGFGTLVVRQNEVPPPSSEMTNTRKPQAIC
jgi:hypothetical protein